MRLLYPHMVVPRLYVQSTEVFGSMEAVKNLIYTRKSTWSIIVGGILRCLCWNGTSYKRSTLCLIRVHKPISVSPKEKISSCFLINATSLAFCSSSSRFSSSIFKLVRSSPRLCCPWLCLKFRMLQKQAVTRKERLNGHRLRCQVGQVNDDCIIVFISKKVKRLQIQSGSQSTVTSSVPA